MTTDAVPPASRTSGARPSGIAMTWLMEEAIEENAGLSLARMTIDPDVTSEAHRHPNCTEAIHVLSGSVLQRRGDAWIELTAGDTILIPVGAVHQTRNPGPETAVMMIAYSSGSRVYQT
ncbi:cupin domain-containing protein [Algihabitans albus]|uniref:cupin domain-containing protein n=1 Tax=Algihabitans albus TaxID=2164067 RepID=UPI000E5D9013|nr:cupin domain-containing protein [Algihabitans albus]